MAKGLIEVGWVIWILSKHSTGVERPFPFSQDLCDLLSQSSLSGLKWYMHCEKKLFSFSKMKPRT